MFVDLRFIGFPGKRFFDDLTGFLIITGLIVQPPQRVEKNRIIRLGIHRLCRILHSFIKTFSPLCVEVCKVVQSQGIFRINPENIPVSTYAFELLTQPVIGHRTRYVCLNKQPCRTFMFFIGQRILKHFSRPPVGL